MNHAQYDTAKDVVLDLLGWGVPPEFFVDCGLTREIVYYVFSELNLRFPQNLDVTGLIPYTPDMAVLAERQPSILMPPPSTTTRSRRYSQGNQTLPSKNNAHPIQKAMAAPPTHTELKPIPAETSQVAINSLHDMEQQRRQELLARKAAIASRKSKQFAISSDPSTSSLFSPADPSTDTHNRGPEVTIPTETVEDFLKTIGPSAEEGTTSVDTDAQSRQRGTDDMDVDEIPGLRESPNQAPPPTPVSAGSELHQSHHDHDVVLDTPPNTSESRTHECPPSSTDSASTAFSHSSVDSASAATDRQSLQRRGTKRPVAADFDLDLGPRLQYNGSGTYSNGVTYSSSSAKHKPIGFASLSVMRRCVIDLSDSEGEGDEDGVMRDVPNPKARWGRRSGYSSPAPVVNTPNGWMTPPVAAITPGMMAAGITGSASMSPAALEEKETEIRKMREMIAQRERDRQKKLAAVSRTG